MDLTFATKQELDALRIERETREKNVDVNQKRIAEIVKREAELKASKPAAGTH